MAHHNLYDETTSESIEMYLLRVALLQQGGQPVPIPRLAQELAIAPVSAHEMCRKLTDKGLVQYEPYKGVTLTAAGDALAQRVLRCRQLWATFFIEKLGLDPQQADEIACRFEHVTPDELADRLAVFLGYDTEFEQPAGQPLLSLAAGERGQVVTIAATDETTQEFLHHQGVWPGIVVEVLAHAADGSLLLDIAGQRLSLSPMLAEGIAVALEPGPHSVSV